MSRKNLFRCFLAFTICFCFLPTTVFAVKITRTNDIWTGAKNLNYSNITMKRHRITKKQKIQFELYHSFYRIKAI